MHPPDTTVSCVMNDPRTLSIQDYTYSLPEERIAKYPLPERDASRLLMFRDGKISQSIYRQIDEHIPSGSLVVFNNTRVTEARLLFQKPTGGTIEIFCLEPHEQYGDISQAMMQQTRVLWNCLIGGASKWKAGQLLEKHLTSPAGAITLNARYIEKKADSFIIELSWQPPSLSFAEILHIAGAIPLPPYLKRAAETSDEQRYQTVYAEPVGSVAAPTAGLHFTPSIFEKLHQKNISTAFVTLHVGAGTFKPVKASVMHEHEMHSEFIDVSKDLIRDLITHIGGTTIAVGTTTLRTLESLYWFGVKLVLGKSAPLTNLEQWDVYDMAGQEVSVRNALQALLDWMEASHSDRLIAKTRIIIAPGYKTRIAKALVTNFHQPQSTLLLLVAALIGNDWKKVYDYALQNHFRFLSYGDGCLLWIDGEV